MSRAVRLVAALGVLGLLLTGCGIESDSSPRELAGDQLPDELLETTTTTVPGGAPTLTRQVWFLSNELLAESPRDVEVAAGVDGALEAVLGGPTDEEQELGLTTSIPAGTELIDTRAAPEEQLLTINLSEELEALGASELRNAVAQLVFTATSFNSAAIQQVRFQIDGQAVSVPARGSATSSLVTRADYADLDPEQADVSG
jgi:hypothetical protein